MNQQAEPFLKDMKEAKDLLEADFAQVHVSRPHESAHLHVSGYTDDLPVVAGTLHAALGLSAKAHARIVSMSFDRRAGRRLAWSPSSTAEDIPGANDVGPIIHGDDPILADGIVQFVGQPMFIVVAMSHDIARRAARRAEVVYDELPAILTAQQARAANAHVLPPMKLARGRTPVRRSRGPRIAKPVKCCSAARNSFTWKVRFRTQCRRTTMACTCGAPRSIRRKCSTWSRTCSTSRRTTCWSNAGGWVAASAGKESQSGLFACCAALAAWKLLCPVKTASGSRRRHDGHRQAARFSLHVRSRL